MDTITDQTAPGLTALGRLAAQAGDALREEIIRRIDETRPAMEALTRQIRADGEAAIRMADAGLAEITRSVRQERP